MARRRIFTNSDRQRFFDAIRVMRDACIDVCRTAPINGPDYHAATRVMERLDDAAGALTGDREALWLKPHGGVRIPDATVKPVEDDGDA